MVALQDAVGERHRLWIRVRVLMDPGHRLYVGFWRFCGCVCGGVAVGVIISILVIIITTIILIIKPKPLLFVTTSSNCC
ncbi:hypothetical protein glysoja_016400 [Glycine soja]|nr:hypothetical protein glysoja_016400 [Glycine soja]